MSELSVAGAWRAGTPSVGSPCARPAGSRAAGYPRPVARSSQPSEKASSSKARTARIATYRELFAALEALAGFDDSARAHLDRVASDYRRLASS